MPKKSLYGTPGVLMHARARRVQAVLLGYFAYCIVAAVVLWTMFDGSLATPVWLLLSVGPVVLYGWRRSLADLIRPAVSALSGRDALARDLGPLATRGYTALHDMDVGRVVVDVIVVGPSGIYAIECSAWPGRFALRGTKLTRSGLPAQRLVQRTSEAADLVARRLALQGLEATVTPVLALTNSQLREGSISLRRVNVLRAGDVASWINRRPVKLETGTIDRAARALG
jgi:hypothetical protein